MCYTHIRNQYIYSESRMWNDLLEERTHTFSNRAHFEMARGAWMGKIRSAKHNQLHRLSLEPASAGFLLVLLFNPEVEAICSSETSGFSQATRHYNTEDRTCLSTQLFGAWSRDRSLGVATDWRADGYEFDFRQRQETFLLYITSSPPPGPIQSSVQCVLGALPRV
jgi:hypothetical protein